MNAKIERINKVVAQLPKAIETIQNLGGKVDLEKKIVQLKSGSLGLGNLGMIDVFLLNRFHISWLH